MNESFQYRKFLRLQSKLFLIFTRFVVKKTSTRKFVEQNILSTFFLSFENAKDLCECVHVKNVRCRIIVKKKHTLHKLLSFQSKLCLIGIYLCRKRHKIWIIKTFWNFLENISSMLPQPLKYDTFEVFTYIHIFVATFHNIISS